MVLKSLQSVTRQSLKPSEVIIVDDCPGYRQTSEISEIYKNSDGVKIRYVANNKNMGLGLSLNQAARKITTKFFARVDCGDLSSPDRFKLQYDYLNAHPEVGLVGAQVRRIDSGRKSQFCTTVRFARWSSLFVTAVGHPTFFGRSEIFRSVKYPPFRLAQDFGFLSQMRKAGVSFVSMPEVLVTYCDSGSGNWAYRQKQNLSYVCQALGVSNIGFLQALFNSRGNNHGWMGRLVMLIGLLLSVPLKSIGRIITLVEAKVV